MIAINQAFEQVFVPLLDTAPKENAPVAEGNKGAEETKHTDCTIPSAPSKEVATLVAKLALARHSVHPISDGGYLVSKYGYSYHAKDFEALKAFSNKLGVS